MDREVNTIPNKASIALSRREIDVLSLAARGKTYDEMATLLPITKETAKTHMEKARFKLGAINKSHAIALAVYLGYVKL